MRHPGKVYGTSNGMYPGSKHYYRKVYSGGRWDEFVMSRTIGTLIQVCCGGSFLGDVRVDHDREAPGVNVLADMRRLPFEDGSFGTVACDPIYSLSFPDRIRLQRELARVARRRILFKAPWVLRATGWHCTEYLLVTPATCSNVSVMTVLERSAQEANLWVER